MVIGPWEAATEDDHWKVPTSWNKDLIWQVSALVPRVVQERVHKLFNLDYDYRIWSWLLDPA